MTTLRKQLQEPFGPWEDAVVLNPKLRTTVLRTLELLDLELLCDGKAVGLNETERYGDDAPRRGRHFSKPVHFSGLLMIRDIWTDLSDDGREMLKRDINKRFEGVNLSNLPRNSQLKVQITGKKHMTVRYLMSDGRWIPDGLLFQSADRRRSYEVKSMVAATYQLSRKYLSRFFFRRVLEDVLEVDPNPPEVEARGLTYFLDHLTNQLKENEQPPATPEADELGDEYLKRGVVVGLLGRSRRLQATTAVEIEAQFILHGHWLLKHEQSIRMRAKRLFDLVKWQRGLRRLRRTTSAPVDDDSDDSTGIITVPRRAPRAQPDPVQVDFEAIPDADFNYDTDESVSSSEPYTSTSSDGDPNPAHDPELLNLVPLWGTDHALAPTWEDDRKWYCPQRGCEYTIHPAHLSQEDRDFLRAKDKRWLKYLDAKRWFWNEELLLFILKTLVTEHWKMHLTERGIRQRTVKGKRGKRTWVRYEWIEPDAHRPWPPKEDTEVKKEIWE